MVQRDQKNVPINQFWGQVAILDFAFVGVAVEGYTISRAGYHLNITYLIKKLKDDQQCPHG